MDEKEIKKPVIQLYKITVDIRSNEGPKLNIDSIQIEHLGEFLENKEGVPYKHNVPKLDKKQLTNAKIYRFPKLTLPRDKMEIIHKKYGSRVIRDKTKADLAVVSDLYFESLTEINWSYVKFTSREDLKNTLLNEKFVEEEEINRLNDLLSSLDGNDKSYFSMNHQYYYNSLPGGLHTFLQTVNDYNSDGYNRRCTYVPVSNKIEYSWLSNNQELLCWDKELNSAATEDSVTITEETYFSIGKIVASSDMENVAIGMEMMANCNTDESFTYLALLFFNNNENMRDCKHWNYVNFKSLKTKFNHYIDNKNPVYTWPYDKLIQNLVKDNALTEFAVQTITKDMFDTVLKRTFGSTGDSVFNIDPSILILKEEYLKKICEEDLSSELIF